MLLVSSFLCDRNGLGCGRNARRRNGLIVADTDARRIQRHRKLKISVQTSRWLVSGEHALSYGIVSRASGTDKRLQAMLLSANIPLGRWNRLMNYVASLMNVTVVINMSLIIVIGSNLFYLRGPRTFYNGDKCRR